MSSQFVMDSLLIRAGKVFRRHVSLSVNLIRSYTKMSVKEINPNMRKLEYAVRGPILLRANELEKDLQKVKIVLFRKPLP